MGLPTSSPDISSLDFDILFDISGAVPAITLTNASSVINPALLKWWYVITTPSNTPIHTGSSSSPDVNHIAWTTLSITPGSWPQIMGQGVCAQIEFSCSAPYVCTLYVADSVNNIFYLQKSVNICRPNGNTGDSCGNFGVAELSIKVDCPNARLVCNDSTNMAYQNVLNPSVQTNIWTLVYPQDNAGNQPDNGVATNTPSVYFPLAFSAEGFNIYLRDFSTYDMGDEISIKVQYKSHKVFNVFCNVDLCALQCDMDRFYKQSLASCGDLQDPALPMKMSQINFLYNKISTGKSEPLCNIDVPATIKEIEKLLGFSSSCCCGNGINLSAAPGNVTTGCCPVSSSVIDIITGNPPANCPGGYFPAQVYNPTGTSIIGLADSMDTLVGILNANSAWQVVGFAFNGGNCKVGWVLVNQGTTPPVVKVGAGSSSTCVGNQQRYTVRMEDVCSVATLVSPADFPLNAYVNFGSGEVYLGSVANVAALIVALNTTPTKPATVTFSDTGAVAAVTINIFNSSCTSFSTPITISTDIGSSSFLFYGSSHLNYSSTPETINGAVDAYGLRGNIIVGKIPGVITGNIQWHSSIKNNMLCVTESNTGKIYFWDVTNPLQPSFVRTIQLNAVVGGCFTGTPHSIGIGGGAVSSFYSLYFPTDTGIFDLGAVFVFEALTGCAWVISPLSTSGTGVLASFQANALIGMCPRVQHNQIIYFTMDGTLAADIGVTPVTAGFIVIVDLSVTFNSSAVHLLNIAGLGTADAIWAASFDGADTIWFMSIQGVLYKYSISLAASSIVTNAMGVAGGFKLRGNMKFFMDKLYCCGLDGLRTPGSLTGTMLVDVSSFPTVTQTFFDTYADESAVAETCKHSHNALPLGNCLILVTGEGYQSASPPGAEFGAVAVFKTDGTFLKRCLFADGQNVYNLAAISRVSEYTPTTLIPV